MKGDVRPGDLAVFFEIDSFLPFSDIRWAFLKAKFPTSPNVQNRGFRVNTIKIRGQISQGLEIPVARFPEIIAHLAAGADQLSDDELLAAANTLPTGLESLIGVVKYEGSSDESGLCNEAALGPFPDFIPRTDQERGLNLIPGLFSGHDTMFTESTKMDGSSMTVYCVHPESHAFSLLRPLNAKGGTVANDPQRIGDTGRIGVCSRNIKLVERKGDLFWDVVLRNQLHDKLRRLSPRRSVAIQGELCGGSIQKNFDGFPGGFHDFFLFAVWDIDAQRHLPPRELEQLARHLEIPHVPVTGYCKLSELGSSLEDLLDRAEGTNVNGKKREWIVLKAEDGAFSFRVISNSCLLKHSE